MTNIFGFLIVCAIALGLLFPYAALSLSEYGFVFLFLLMFFSGFSMNWRRLPQCFVHPKALLTGLFLSFILIPMLQWGMAGFLLKNEGHLMGFLFASLMPVAVVAPFFTEKADGDAELAYALMMVSTLLTPLLAPLLFFAFAGSSLPLQITPLFMSVGLFVLTPLVASAGVSWLLKPVERVLKRHLPILNALSLGALIFILFGSVIIKLNFNYIPGELIAKLLLLAFFQDFGIYFIFRMLLAPFFEARTLRALVISLSMKNVAISAGVMLFYDPKAALPSALVFVAHSLLFSFVVLMTKPSTPRTPSHANHG